MDFYKERTLSERFLKASKNFKVILLTGMRQVGKTTFLERIKEKNRESVSLDDVNELMTAKEDSSIFFQNHEPPIFIDEIQYAPSLFSKIKILADKAKQNGLVWLSGSQPFLLMKEVSETLAGRIAVLNLLGLFVYERFDLAKEQKPFLPAKKTAQKLKKLNIAETFKIIWKGSFPEMVLKEEDEWDLYYASYVKTYLERDVRQLVKVGDVTSFFKFLKSAAARTAQELNIDAIARDVDVAPNTVKSWLSILETSGIICFLQPYYKNISKRIVKRPKMYFLDTGLATYLADWKTAKVLQTGAASGAFFETFVVTEIIKSHRHNGLDTSFYYYRDNAKNEVDLLFAQNGKLYPIEIKQTANPNKEMIKNFSKLSDIGEVDFGSLICLVQKPVLLTQNANAVSIWDI
ncbi:MAG: ATP-binding protein [Elusimicrobiota bacterium]|jgi:predicted AAA+ superfamily ATPase|nr:ATP-binding protein [Elusimicrobiota bacterium]